MKINDAGRAIIETYEGCKLEAYLCPAGVPTIGFGHTGDVKLGDKITQHQAEVLLEYDLEHFEGLVSKAVTTYKVNANQFSALVSIVFNVGPGKKGVRDGIIELKNGEPSTLLKRLNAGGPLAAANEFGKWTHGGGVELPGLVKRRAAERALFLEVPS